MKDVLIAESGGTKTDWCLIRNKQIEKRITSFSLHPVNWTPSFFTKLNTFLNTSFRLEGVDIIIYSSGCHQESNRVGLMSRLYELGYNAEVKSDLVAAGKATLYKNFGKVAILGTGSVLFTFENGEAQDLIGGLGHEKGDQGSGYYFGKLILDAWQQSFMSESQRKILTSLINVEELLEKVGSEEEKLMLATIAEKLKDHKNEFKEYHQKNFQLFCDTHDLGTELIELYVVGSYGYYHQEILFGVLARYNVKLINVVERPIDVLIEQMVSFSD